MDAQMIELLPAATLTDMIPAEMSYRPTIPVVVR